YKKAAARSLFSGSPIKPPAPAQLKIIVTVQRVPLPTSSSRKLHFLKGYQFQPLVGGGEGEQPVHTLKPGDEIGNTPGVKPG
ncbi:hypothetical protein OESDEN_23000, partial [Oesophagostomum dentatum]